MLDFVDTPKRMVTLAADGQRFLRAASPEARRAVWREQLLKLRLFRNLNDVFERQPEHQLERDFVFETLALALPDENYGRMFDRLTRWAQAGGLFEYDAKHRRLRRPEP